MYILAVTVEKYLYNFILNWAQKEQLRARSLHMLAHDIRRLAEVC